MGGLIATRVRQSSDNRLDFFSIMDDQIENALGMRLSFQWTWFLREWAKELHINFSR